MHAISRKWKFRLRYCHIRLNRRKYFPQWYEVGLALLAFSLTCKSPCVKWELFPPFRHDSMPYSVCRRCHMKFSYHSFSYFESVCHIRKFTWKEVGISVAIISNYFIDYQCSQITRNCTALWEGSAFRIFISLSMIELAWHKRDKAYKVSRRN